MSRARPVLFALAALLSAPAVAHAADDDVCLAWVHNFEDVEVNRERDTVSFSSTSSCLGHGQTLEDLTLPEGLPHQGGEPAWWVEKECAWIDREIAAMRRAVLEATARLPGAEAALESAIEDSRDEQAAYEAARVAWQKASNAVADAKAAYVDMYEVRVEIERDRDGHVVIARQIGYDGTTALGRAVVEAMQRERAARQTMNEAWARWSGAGGSAKAAQAAQFRVDQYRNVLDTYPGAIEQARAWAAELGCM